MKIFLDTAILDEIREADSWGILDGVTTNPSLAAKAGRDFQSNIMAIGSGVDEAKARRCASCRGRCRRDAQGRRCNDRFL